MWMPELLHAHRRGTPVEACEVEEHERLHRLAEIRWADQARDRSARVATCAVDDVASCWFGLCSKHVGSPVHSRGRIARGCVDGLDIELEVDAIAHEPASRLEQLVPCQP